MANTIAAIIASTQHRPNILGVVVAVISVGVILAFVVPLIRAGNKRR